MTDPRFQALTDWCRQQLSDKTISLEAVSGDASFRRYFRTNSHPSLIAVDAPPEKENSQAFVSIDRALFSHGVRVPQIKMVDLEKGFMLLEDFGNNLLLDFLQSNLAKDSADDYYQQAMNDLLHLKDCTQMPDYQLPPYDEALLMSEMQLFCDWYLDKHLGFGVGSDKFIDMTEIFDTLIHSAMEQPKVCVHLDYHSRNLMLLDSGEIGIIDFQDAVIGPITYDLVSLLKDCYIAWPADRVWHWLESYYQQLLAQQIPGLGDLEQFIRWFDLMGMQRHFKAIGIFARLNYRDNKPGYLADIPRTLEYIYQCCLIYPEFKDFGLRLKSLNLFNGEQS